MSPMIVPPPVHRERPRIVARLRRWFGWGHQEDYGYRLPPKVGPRRPVEHGPTKAPFSRAHRRRRRIIARHSRARNWG